MTTVTLESTSTWFAACRVADVPANGGVCVQYGDHQIALFHFARRGEWYATQNECPHRRQMALSRGMIGSTQDEPKVACPFHKKTFSLVTGECLSGDECAIKTYPVNVDNGTVFIQVEAYDEATADHNHGRKKKTPTIEMEARRRGWFDLKLQTT